MIHEQGHRDLMHFNSRNCPAEPKGAPTGPLSGPEERLWAGLNGMSLQAKSGEIPGKLALPLLIATLATISAGISLNPTGAEASNPAAETSDLSFYPIHHSFIDHQAGLQSGDGILAVEQAINLVNNLGGITATGELLKELEEKSPISRPTRPQTTDPLVHVSECGQEPGVLGDICTQSPAEISIVQSLPILHLDNEIARLGPTQIPCELSGNRFAPAGTIEGLNEPAICMLDGNNTAFWTVNKDGVIVPIEQPFGSDQTIYALMLPGQSLSQVKPEFHYPSPGQREKRMNYQTYTAQSDGTLEFTPNLPNVVFVFDFNDKFNTDDNLDFAQLSIAGLPGQSYKEVLEHEQQIRILDTPAPIRPEYNNPDLAALFAGIDPNKLNICLFPCAGVGLFGLLFGLAKSFGSGKYVEKAPLPGGATNKRSSPTMPAYNRLFPSKRQPGRWVGRAPVITIFPPGITYVSRDSLDK